MFDYGIEMYSDNGEKDGMFRQCHQLFNYGKPNFNNNAEIYDIIAPSTKDGYSRLNPICKDPEIIIRNSGSNVLRTLTMNYGLENEEVYTFIWNGSLEFTEKENVILPNIDWLDFQNTDFYVEVSYPNGIVDEYDLMFFAEGWLDCSYWDAADYEPGRSQDSFDKQIIRDYLETLHWDKQPPPPTIPDDILAKAEARYGEITERLMG